MKDEDLRFDRTCHVQSRLCCYGANPRTVGTDDNLCERL